MQKAQVLAGFVLSIAASWFACAPAAFAQAKYPVKPIRILIPFPAAGAADTIGRTLGEQLVAQMGQPVVVDNRAGAAGRLATEMLARAEGDGYTLLVGGVGPLSISPSLYKKLPYKGGGPALIDMVSGDIQVMFATYVTAFPHIRGGRLRAIAVSTPQRQALLPDLSAVGEVIPRFGASNWNGMFAPAKTPRQIADRLFSEINKAMLAPEVKNRQNVVGIAPEGSASRAEFVKFIHEDTARWATIVKAADIKVD